MRHAILALVLASLSGAAQAQAPELTVYTYGSFASEWGPGPKIKEAFEAKCHCDLKFVSLDDGVAILNRLRLEGRHSPADLVVGMDNAMLADARATGLFAPHGADIKALSLPGGWQDDTFVPFDYGYFAFVYDSSKLEHPPKSLKELVERPDLTLLYQDPRTSTPGQGLLLWVKTVYGDQAPAAWQQLAKKTVTVTKGWSEAYGMFLEGQADLVLSYTSSPAYHRLAENKQQYHAALFDEGHLAQIEVAARLKTAPHPDLAQQFLQFMVSDQVQRLIPTGNWMYPVTQVALPEHFEEHELPAKTLHLSETQIQQGRKAWIQEWRQAVSR